MFAAQLMTTPDLTLLGSVGAAIVVWTGGVLLAGWLLSKLPRRIAGALSVALLVASTATIATPTTRVIIDGLDCCESWFLLLFLCIPTWLGIC